ncbi:MAG: hypothetical protein K2W94_06715 [Alphaproteobacteria bacterium]|nr:hypothetical protein [Alphaproteobacteria bacterium]
MTQNRPWTDQELKQVETDYLNGERIKIIAHRLNRSINSLNKALNRYGIRNPKNPSTKKSGYIKWEGIANYCKGKLSPIIDYKSPKPKKDLARNNPPHSARDLIKIKKVNNNNDWVSLREAVDYIKSKGISIQAFRLTQKTTSSAYRDATFFLDHKPCGPLKVALFANKLRLEEGKKTFLIKEVTW